VKIQKQTNLLTQRALTVGEALDESAETSAAGNADLHFTDRAPTLASLLRILHGPVEIESLRLGERLKVEQTLDPDALRVLMPPFSLQPLVENAVQHGLHSSPQAGQLQLAVGVTGQWLEIGVNDDGPCTCAAAPAVAYSMPRR